MLRSIFVLFTVFAALSAPALAEDEETVLARKHLEKAKLHYKLGEFEQAIVEYKEVYRLKPVPAILFNLAQALRMAGDYKQSRFQYENYLRDMPNAPNKLEVERQIAQLTELIKEEEAAAARDEPPKTDSDPVIVIVDQDPREEREEKDPIEPVREDPKPTLAEDVIKPLPDPVVEDTAPLRLAPMIVGGVAAVLAVASGVTYGLARGDWDEATARERPRAEVDALISTGDTKHTASLGLAGAALLAGGGAAVLFAF